MLKFKLSACLLLLAVVPAHGQNAGGQSAPDLGALSIDQLANVQVTSVSRRPEQLSKTAASVFVISAEDIRRSGAGSLPEVLRLAPNLEVARMNGFAWTISARGFNSPESANKLLVLIDGRSVYSPLASTVFWENIDVPLSNIARIEVISGPGGTLYGANAVNGVINIVTKSASQTNGGLAEARIGATGSNKETLNYDISPWDGGAIRVYGQQSRAGGSAPVLASDLTRTGWARAQGGFRIDQSLNADTFTLSGDVYANHTPSMALEIGRGDNLTGHWNHLFSDGESIDAQAYFDESDRTLPGLAREQLQTYDAEIQHNTSLGLGDSFIWGAGYRQFKESFYTPGLFTFVDPTTTISLADIFGQEEFSLTSSLKLTTGLKLENNSYSGIDVMPNVRLALQLSESDMIWTAVSRAARTPSKVDRELEAPAILLPSPNFGSEILTAYELGYKGEPLPAVSVSASIFYNTYDDIRSDQGTPMTIFPVMLENGVRGHTYGAEAWAKYSLTDWWRLNFGVSWINKDFRNKAGYNDLALGQSEGQDPALQAQIRSQANLFDDWEIDGGFRYVGKVTQEAPISNTPQIFLVPEYVEADARIGWHATPTTEIALYGLNILHNRHLEANDPSTYSPQYAPRSFVLTLRQSF